ncbi:Endonuclease/exonuclease/phosphatase, partial [Favolaschia claudopus]
QTAVNDQRHNDIENLFGRCLKVKYTADPNSPTNRAGVAIVLNKTLLKTDRVTTHEIIPGRAMLMEVEWHDEEPLSILGVYAPNSPAENAQFWYDIKAWFQSHPRVRKPSAMGGDTNVVEDSIDRLPSHPDADIAVTALDELKSYLGLMDGWRATYPTTLAYTYLQKSTGSQSRIDRIHVKRGIFDQTYEWKIQASGIQSDHKMVSVRITSANAPSTGPGRWVWPKHIMGDKNLKDHIQEEGMKLQAQLLSMSRRPLETILGDKTLQNDERILSAAVLTEKLTRLYVQQHSKARINARIRNKLEGEVISKYWSMINKPKKPRDIIHRLRKPRAPNAPEDAPPIYETNSGNMANIARNYHNDIQHDRNNTPPDEREATIQTVLGRTARRLSEEQAETLRKNLTREDVVEALKLSANDKAPGEDGIMYEVWKILD